MNRWVINRVGLLNFWYYQNKIFEFANGKMLLRGANGSGKSLTMQSLFPVLFDGNTSPYRLDSFGSADRKMEDYLLGEKGVSDRDEGVGYLFLEVKRESREEYLTVGIGMHANRGGKLNKWFFAIENNERIGIDIELYEELRKGELTPLTKQKLRNRLETKGRTFDRQRDYKTYVNENIFGFDHLEQFDELIDLLINLRTPKLSKEFRPTVIYNILRDSLPKLKDDELLTLSKTIEQLDGHRERLEDLSNELRELNRFSKIYGRWHEELVGQIAGKWSGFLKEKNRLEKDRDIREKDAKQMEQAELRKRAELSENIAQLEAIENNIHELNRHEGINLVARGEELREQLKDTIHQLTKIEADINRKKQRLNEQKEQLAKRQLKQAEYMDELETLLIDNEQYGEYLQLTDLEATYAAKFRAQITRDEFQYWKERVQRKRQHFQHVIQVLHQLEQLESQLADLARETGSIQQKVDELERDLRHWQQIRRQELENWKQAVDYWRKEAAFPLAEKDYANLLFQIDRLLEEDVREEVVLAPIYTSYQAASNKNQVEANILKGELVEWQEQKEQIEAEIKVWQEKKIPEIQQRNSRKKNREELAEQERFIPFYRAVDFIEGVDETIQAKLEGALYASGILDSLIGADRLILADDIQILPQPKLLALTLADFLTVNSTVDQSLKPLVMDVLQSIVVDEEDPELPAIFRDGSYRIANLHGEMPADYQASYIGALSQERYRQAKIAELTDEAKEIAVFMTDITEKINAKEKLEEKMQASYQNCPNGNEVYEAIEQMKAVNLQLTIQTDVLKVKQKQLADLESGVNNEKIALHRMTNQDGLTLSVEKYQEAEAYANNYEANLNDAYRNYEMFKVEKERVDALNKLITELVAEENDLLLTLSDLNSRKQTQERLVDENLKQQKIINVEELQIRLSTAIEEQRTRKKFQEETYQALQVLANKKTTNDLKLQSTEEALAKVTFEELHWQELFDKEVHRFAGSEIALDQLAREKSREASIKKLKDLEGQIITQFNFLADQLQNYNPQLINQSVLELAEENEQDLGDFAQYNNYKRPNFKTENQSKTAFALLEYLTEQRMTLQDLLKKDDEQLFKKIILESVGNILRVRIQQAMQWVEQINELLELQKNSSGLSLSIQWKGLPSTSEQDLGTVRLVELLQKPTKILSDIDREAISRHFQEKVQYAQEQIEENMDEQSTLFQAISKVLDYRDWFQFELKYKRANEGYRQQVLTDRRFNQFSGGEKAIVMYLPLFAAVDSKYADASTYCPKMITLDEAFAGIDDLNIAELFKACEQLGFNYVMNSQVLYGDYPTVSQLMMYELLRPQNINIVTTIPYYWDGHQRRMLTEGLVHERQEDLF